MKSRFFQKYCDIAHPQFDLEVKDERDFQLTLFKLKRIIQDCDFEEAKMAALLTAASELSRNMLKYADGGLVSCYRLQHLSKKGVFVRFKDTGPGIEDIEQAMQQNYSSSGTLGLGLPGAKRLADDFAIESTPGEGCRVYIVKWSEM